LVAIHPIFTPYYMIPTDMLSFWNLLFATPGLRAAKPICSQPANARLRYTLHGQP
jgi:hypothetical protein